MQALPALPSLIADVGGTNLRFALVSNDSVGPIPLKKLATADFTNMSEAAHFVVSSTGVEPRSAIFAIAAPARGTRIKLTNADFVIDLEDVCERLGLQSAVFLNDFEALAVALPALQPDDLEVLHEGIPDPEGARVVLGAGTGLGAAVVVNGGEGFVPVPGEAGHITFGAETEDDFTFWPYIERRDGCISPEVILSGSGLSRLYRAICASENQPPRYANQVEITKAAAAGDEQAKRTVLTFLRLLGRSAGDLAVVPWATGGIYLGGGLIEILSDYVHESGLVEAARKKAPHEEDMKAFPIYRIIRPDPALFGMSVFLKQTQPISIPLKHRSFTRVSGDMSNVIEDA